MDFIWDTFTVGFWFTTGAVTCIMLFMIFGAVVIRIVTDLEYKIAERRRRNATS